MAELGYGFIQHADYLNDLATEVGIETMEQAIAESAREWSRQVQIAMDQWVEPTTAREMKILLPGEQGLQPLDADGNPRPRKITGSYSAGFPMRWAGTAYGLNRETKETVTVGHINRWYVEAEKADKVWNRRQMLKAILDNVTWTYVDETVSEDADPDTTVYPLANNDGTAFTLKNGTISTTENHYHAQAADISDAANPFTAIWDDLAHHPSNNISQTGVVITYVASNLVEDIQGLANLKEVTPDFIIPGTNADRLSNEVLQYVGFGDMVVGWVDKHIIVEWSALPDGYMISWPPGAGKVLKMRQMPQTALQGFFEETADIDGNHKVFRLLRKAGYAVHNRIGLVATKIGASPYTTPTGYTASVDI